MDKMNTIISAIKNKRIELNMSYKDLADKTGLSKSTLQRYETGGIKNIPLDKLKILCDALGISTASLLWDENEFIKRLFSYFQSAYHAAGNKIPNNHEVLEALVKEGIINQERLDLVSKDYNNLLADEIKKIIEYIQQLNYKTYLSLLLNEDIDRVEILGRKISEQRNKKHISLEELSIKCNLDKSYLEKLENGVTSYPPKEFIDKICNSLGISFDSSIFVERTEYKRKFPNPQRMRAIKFHNKFVQNTLLYNFILSVLISKNATGFIDDLIAELNLDTIEQLATQILNDTGNYLLSTVNTSLNILKETPSDLSLNKEALNSQIEVFDEYFSYDIKAMTHRSTEDSNIK